MKLFFSFTLSLLLLSSVCRAGRAPDSLLVTGPNNQQVPSTQILVTPTGGVQSTLGSALANAGCTSNCTISGALNGWTIGFSAQNGATIVAGGSGYAAGDQVTLNDSCATHIVLGVTTVSTGAVTGISVVNPGVCAVAPSGTLSVSSTTGAGSGSTYTVTSAPIGLLGMTGTLTSASGNTFIGAEQNLLGFTGTESTFIGDRSGGNITGGSFILAIGHNACGIGAGVPLTNLASTTCLGTDAGRNITDNTLRSLMIGSGTGQNVGGNDNTFVGTAAATSNFTSGINTTILGSGAGSTLTTASGDVIIGYKADSTIATALNTVIIGGNNNSGQAGARCPGNSVCIGAQLGNASVNSAAGKHVIIGATAAQTNLTGGTQDILIGYGVDMPSGQGNSNLWINLGNAILARAAAPTISSGFGTSPSVSAGASSAGFAVNVGTGGTASSGVVGVSTIPAPNGWACVAVDQTNPDTSNTVAIPTSTTTITLKNYSRTTGAVTAWAASDVIVVHCNGY